MLPLNLLATVFTAGLAIAASIPPLPGVAEGRPTLDVPTLPEVQAMLARLQGPIISTIISRAALPAESLLYANGGKALTSFIHKTELIALTLNTYEFGSRYDYGSLEYPFTLPAVGPDITTPTNPFPPGRFHQDTFTPNADLLSFYVTTLVPLIEDANTAIAGPGGSSPFYHLKRPSSPVDVDAKYTLDDQLLALLSHWASIGKVVAEVKYRAHVAEFTPLIKSGNVNALRTLLTNTTQEKIVLESANSAAFALATAFEAAQNDPPAIAKAFVSRVQTAVARVYRELIDVTKEVEIQYLLQRFH
ncbi:hypothetical protein DXG03_002374 [Asterophora parasitica]|uniref:chorismate mutase n=1 Tax=Asterophora parasitica TaxID=117018 RepID=A0A9P7G232_9AGAR|nr:hypothetical protein DXG03_002374 [Asterophora parasitica]